MLKFALSNLLSCLLFCGQLMAQSSKVDSSEMRTLRIDPSLARGAAASQVFEEIKFIPLETTKESLFGSIHQLRIADGHYIIYDYDTKAILIFSLEGKYKAKISGSAIEKDPDSKENQNFYGFTLKKENGQQLIQVLAGKYLYAFGLDGKLVSKAKQDGTEYYRNSHTFTDGTEVMLSYLQKQQKDSLYYSVALLKDKKRMESYFPYSPDRYNNDQFFSGGHPLTNYGVTDELFFVEFYNYNVYKVTPKKLYLAYKVIFPAVNSLPADFMDNPIYKGKRSEYFQRNPKVYYATGSHYKIGDNLYFKVNNWTWGPNERKAFIYNLKSNVLTSISDIEPDSLSQFLPVTDAGMYHDFANRGFHLYDQGYFYTSYSSLMIFNAQEQNLSKNRKYSPELETYFKTQNKKSNPVIIQLKPKKN